MLTYRAALDRLHRHTPAARATRVPLAAALGLVLARPVRATASLPGFDNSAVDGYAVNGTGHRVFRVRGVAMAGTPWRGRLRPGEAARIFTGAMTPRGTGAVVMQEHVVREGRAITLSRPPDAGANIRWRGEDVRPGAVVLPAGRVLRPNEIGLLAALGHTTVPAYPRPRVAVLVNGDELAAPGARLAPGHIHDVNGPVLDALLREAGATPFSLGVVRDGRARLRRAIRRGLRADVLLVCGGVSGGDRDLVRPALRACGVHEVFWRVSIKPGMPVFFGTLHGVPVFGLPGNPVSVFVTFVEFVRPVLDRLLGRPVRDPYAAVARLASPVTLTRSRRTHFVRVRLNGAPGKLTARPLAGQGSHRLHSLAGATGWIRLESRRGPWAAGAMVPVRAGDDSRC